jgi:hypothetical protein
MDIHCAAENIISLKNADLSLRERLIHDKQLYNGYSKEMEALHIRNAEKLHEIIDSIGFPTVEKVGKEANEAAWLIIQHAISQPEFMKKCLVLMQREMKQTLHELRQKAYLTDRIAVFEGKPQQYGTQFDWDDDGLLSPSPFDDLEKVNERRRYIGLNSLEEQTAVVRSQASIDNQTPPTDLTARRREIDLWKEKVGWFRGSS